MTLWFLFKPQDFSAAFGLVTAGTPRDQLANAGAEHPRWEFVPRPSFLRMLGDQSSSAAVLWSLQVFPSPTLYFLVDK